MAHESAKPPTHPRPASPPKHRTSLPGIPEVTPGPNAFAQQAERMERHRFDGNAFYQQEVQKRKVTPPTNIHPAFRTASGNQIHAPSGLMISSEDPRGSTMTTMSAFINAGKHSSPPLNLVPNDGQFTVPTRRGYIEDRREQMAHEASGSDEERVPVYETFSPTPKVKSSEFTPKRAAASTPRKARMSLPKKDVAIADGQKSPKKSFFDKLRMTKLTGAQHSPSMTTLRSTDGAIEEPDMPVKAQAVLGVTTSKNILTRSPSKQKKSLFSSRRPSDVADLRHSDGHNSRSSTSTGTEEPPLSASTQTKTPQTAHTTTSEPTYLNGKRVPSQTLSDRGGYGSAHEAHKCIVQRSQSLKYLDNKVPPTPPAKNTPPHEKSSMKTGVASASRLPFQSPDSMLPSGAEGILSTSDRLSPTKFGGYAYKEQPMLVTKPSIYSLHASVVPEMMEASTFEEIKGRFDGLALEGFDMPHETHHPRSPEVVYSPSVYGSEWGMSPDMAAVRPSSMGARTGRAGFRSSMGDLFTLTEASNERDSPSHRQKKSSSSGGSRSTIPVIYPELESDPSVQNLLPRVQEGPEFVHTPDRPRHGQTHSRDHSDSPRHSRDVSLFAMPMDDEQHDQWQSTPASFSQASAVPSPLHPLQYLPATVYTPPPPKASRKRTDSEAQLTSLRHRASGLGIRGNADSDTAPPSRKPDVFESAPSFLAPPVNHRSTSPRQNMSAFAAKAEVSIDPKKGGLARQSGDKQDEVLALLNKLINRNSDVDAMREELRATNARLDARLAAMDGSSRSASPNPSSLSLDAAERLTVSSGSGSGSGSGPLNRSHSRVATEDAHEFYRLIHSQGNGSPAASSVGEVGPGTEPSNEGDRITELTESNRKLTEMVNSMAAQVEELKRKLV